MIRTFLKGFVKGLSGQANLPAWLDWTLIIAMVAGAGVFGYTQGVVHGSTTHTEYITKQGAETVRIVEAQAKVITKTEIIYRDRIKTVYVQGEKIEARIPDYIQPADNAAFSVNAGFVRILDAAWAGQDPGPTRDADRGPAGVPLDAVATVEAGNIATCHAWRLEALGWRDYYAGLQKAVNGRVGDWYKPVVE